MPSLLDVLAAQSSGQNAFALRNQQRRMRGSMERLGDPADFQPPAYTQSGPDNAFVARSRPRPLPALPGAGAPDNRQPVMLRYANYGDYPGQSDDSQPDVRTPSESMARRPAMQYAQAQARAPQTQAGIGRWAAPGGGAEVFAGDADVGTGSPLEDSLRAATAFAADEPSMMQPTVDRNARLRQQVEELLAQSQGQGKNDGWMALAKAGFTAAGGTSPYALTNIGQGGVAGIEDYQKSQAARAAEQAKALGLGLNLSQLDETGRANMAQEADRRARTGLEREVATQATIPQAKSRIKTDAEKLDIDRQELRIKGREADTRAGSAAALANYYKSKEYEILPDADGNIYAVKPGEAAIPLATKDGRPLRGAKSGAEDLRGETAEARIMSDIDKQAEAHAKQFAVNQLGTPDATKHEQLYRDFQQQKLLQHGLIPPGAKWSPQIQSYVVRDPSAPSGWARVEVGKRRQPAPAP